MTTSDPHDLTPVEERGDIWVKREDLFTFGGVWGAKARVCVVLAERKPGATLVTAGARVSPLINTVAHVAHGLGRASRAHIPEGALPPEMLAAEALGCELVRHKAGRLSVLRARCRADAEETGAVEIPWAAEHPETLYQSARQVANLPPEAKRLVVPVGSAMTLAGILRGLEKASNPIPVLGIMVGAEPYKRLDRWGPSGWRHIVELRPSGLPYEERAPETVLGGVQLDPYYEAKAIPFVEPGDCFWAVAIRATEAGR